jgi:bacterioferritin-associated ferredoxin
MILDTTERGALVRAAPFAAGFLLSPLLGKGLGLKREVARAVKIVTGVWMLRAEGEGGLERLTYETGSGSHTVELDTLLVHQGVVPDTNLAMAAGVAHRWDERQVCWRPELDAYGNTSVPGILMAGDGAGIAGGEAAVERGRLAGMQVVRDLAPDVSHEAEQAVRQRLARYERARPFLDTFFRPAKQMRVPPDNATIVCRCEEVTAGSIRDAVRLGCDGPNQLKAFTRCGMGPCQGRLCGLTATELIADERGTAPGVVGHYRIRPPVKPVSLGELAAMPAGDTAVKAVVR